MKSYIKPAMTAVLVLMFMLLTGFRAQTIIHDDGSETQDVLKVSDSARDKSALESDADEFQKRNYTIMDYDNGNGKGFRAMKTLTSEAANQRSVDRIVHKTFDGIICTMYYIDYTYTDGSIDYLRLGKAMPEDGVDLEYIVSFPSGTDVQSNSPSPDEQGKTYMWRLSDNKSENIRLQATVWHKLTIYAFLFLIVLIVLLLWLWSIDESGPATGIRQNDCAVMKCCFSLYPCSYSLIWPMNTMKGRILHRGT